MKNLGDELRLSEMNKPFGAIMKHVNAKTVGDFSPISEIGKAWESSALVEARAYSLWFERRSMSST